MSKPQNNSQIGQITAPSIPETGGMNAIEEQVNRDKLRIKELEKKSDEQDVKIINL